jgi:hypothetical protein
MSAKSTFAAFVLLAAVSSHGAASAQDYFGPAGKRSEAGQMFNRMKSKVPSDTRASTTSPGRTDYRAPGGAYPAAPAQQNETWKRTYPDYPFQNGGGG